MSSRSFDNVKDMLVSVRNTNTATDKMTAYDTWAENYDQDVAILGYKAFSLAAKMVSSHFSGNREAAVVLDVACGTGLLAEHMMQCGFHKFVGVDGSKLMLEEAKKKGQYQELKQCIIGEQQLPVSKDSFDVVVICGSLSIDHVPVCVVKELCSACKPGGLVFMTCRHGQDNMEYKESLERELKEMEEKGLWSCVEASEKKHWARGVVESEQNYISGSMYLYQKK
ncbi:methyltransferase-like protein 27 [Gouania willdenowi]|uniref:Methyltransferase-like protein 27 n=1 Tax=Gouania willdenowi TaxID=441366 RepID=A0A8C5D6U1_GOUWI|nr:methyltransferase-like protein 27 [Gouania willdenowi]